MARGQWTPVSRLIRCCIFSPSVRCNIRSACALRGKSAVGRGGNIQSIIFSRPMLQMLSWRRQWRDAARNTTKERTSINDERPVNAERCVSISEL